MQIELFPYERRALEAPEREFALDRELVVGFADSLNKLASMFKHVGVAGEDEFKAGRVVVIGLLNHVHHLLAGGLQALQVGNGPVWSACVRGLIETFGACVLISERSSTAPNYLEHVKPGKLRAAAERAHPGLGGDIDRLNQIVHPVSGAIFAGFKPRDAASECVDIPFGLHPFTADEGREGVIVLANLAALLVGKLKELSTRRDVLLAGKLIMVRETRATNGP
jgi:hypothetical protein